MAIVGFSGFADAQTSVSWLSAVSGTWTDGTKWSSNPVYPNNGSPAGATYAVSINATGSPYVVELKSDVTLSSLNINSTAATVLVGNQLSGGTLTILNGIDLTSGILQLTSLGTLRGGTIASSGNGVLTAVNTGSLNGVTLSGSLTMTGSFFALNDLTVNAGSISLGNGLANDELFFAGEQGLNGSGRLEFNSFSQGTIGPYNFATLTLGHDIELRSGTSNGFVGISGGRVINQGTITATNEKRIRVGVETGLSWTNTGTLVANNGTLELGGTFSTADIGRHLTLNGGQVKLTGGTLNNTGATFFARSDDQAIAIGKNLTVLGGTISSVGGTILQIDGGSGSAGACVLDGVALLSDVAVSNQSELQIRNALPFTGQTIRITGGTLRLSADAAIAGNASILLADSGSQLLPPTSGSLTIGPGVTVISNGVSNLIGQVQGATPQFINQGLIRTTDPSPNVTSFRGSNEGTIHADGGIISALISFNSGTMLTTNGGRVVFSGINNGTITADHASISAQGTLTQIGTMIVSNGSLTISDLSTAQALAVQRINSDVFITGTLNNSGAQLPVTGVNGQWEIWGGRIAGGSITSGDASPLRLKTGTGTIENASIYAPVQVDNSTLSLTGAWHNFGTISLQNGTVSIQNPGDNQGMILGTGTIASAGSWVFSQLGAFDGNNTTIVIGGTLDNSSTTLDLAAANAWYLNSGSIAGGTITSSNHAKKIVVLGTNSQIGNVKLDADLDLGRVPIQGSRLTATGIELLNDSAIALVGAGVTLTVGGGVSGNGSVLIGVQNRVVFSGENTLGSGITIRRHTNGVATLSGSSTLVNNGQIVADVAGARLVVSTLLRNNGVLASTNGGSIALLNSSSLLNYTSGTLTGGTWRVGAGSTMTFGSSTITTNNATIVLDGVGSTFAPINQLRGNLGRFTITNGRDFNSVGSLTNSGSIVVGPGSTLNVLDSFNNLSGLLDLNFKMVVDYTATSPLDELVGQIGSQIISSAVNADPGLAIGSIDDGNVVRLQIVANGDANLDGIVNYNDLSTLASNYTSSDLVAGSLVAVPTSLNDPKWVDGDFNYDGAVNLTDLYALGWQYKDPEHPLNQSLQTLGLPPINVPEPGMIGLAIAGMGLLARRRRVLSDQD